MERRRTGNILEKGSTGSRPGRGGGSWGELPWASVLGWVGKYELEAKSLK